MTDESKLPLIVAAYEEARGEAKDATGAPLLPEWDQLSHAMRGAFVEVYYQGRIDQINEDSAGAKP